MGYYQGRNEDF